MSRYTNWWHPNVSRAIKAYPALLAKKDAIQRQNIIANYSADPKAGGASRATENVALRDLPPGEAAIVDAIGSALDEIAKRKDGDEILRLIDLVHFRRSHTLYGAAAALNMSERSAQMKNGDFIKIAARKLGYY